MEYYGIQTPAKKDQEPHIWWLSGTEWDAWHNFFIYPSKDKKYNGFSLDMSTSKKAYKAIGYKCVKFEIKIIEEI